MRVILISTEFPPGPGGIATHAYELARYLSREHELSVFTSQDYTNRSSITEFNIQQTFRVHSSGTKISLMGRAFWDARKASPEKTVGIATGTRALQAASLIFGQHIPWIAVIHGHELLDRTFFEKRRILHALSMAKHIVCVSNYARHNIQGVATFHQPISVVLNGADMSRFRPLDSTTKDHVRASLGWRSPTMVTLGRICDRKGQETVIRLLPEIKKQVPNVRYAMIGLPEIAPRLIELAEHLGVKANIEIHSGLDGHHVAKILGAADLHILLSKQASGSEVEGFGIVVLEAAACAIPSVVSDHGGLPEAVCGGNIGWIAPSNDLHASAQIISKCLLDDQSRKHMGQHAETWVRKNATWDIVGQKFDSFLKNMLQNNTPNAMRKSA